MDNQLSLLYDRSADVLYVSRGHPTYTDYVELDPDIILRLDPQSKDVVGFTIIDFVGRFAKKSQPQNLPLDVKFARSRSKPRARTAAEKKTSYQVKRKG